MIAADTATAIAADTATAIAADTANTENTGATENH
jgi:hypothetical protein